MNTSFGRILVLAAVLSAFGISPAAASIVFTPTTIPGVSFVGYGDPNFPAALLKAMPSANHSDLAPVLPFGAVVTNTGTKVIAYVAVRFDYTDPATGKARSSSQAINRTTAHQSEWIKPGEALFFAPTNWHPLTARVPDPEAESAVATSMQRYAGDSLTASLDAVAFDDGEFDGPDVGNHYGEMTVAWTARQDLFRELQLMSGSSDADILARLEAIKREPPSQSPSTVEAALLEGVRTRTRQLTAVQLSSRLKASRASFESMLAEKGFLVHRP
jgi:hypothetical protein